MKSTLECMLSMTTRARGTWARMSRARSMPLPSGSEMSTMIRSGRMLLARARPSAQVPASPAIS